jgi:hypothetical protein
VAYTAIGYGQAIEFPRRLMTITHVEPYRRTSFEQHERLIIFAAPMWPNGCVLILESPISVCNRLSSVVGLWTKKMANDG